MELDTIRVLSVPVAAIRLDEAMEKVRALMEEPGFHLVATANAEMVMQAQKDRHLLEILQGASLVIPDGAGVLWAAEQQGQHFPERVAGCDLARQLFAMTAKEQLPVYCLGAAPGVVEAALENLEKEFGPLCIAGSHNGYFDDEEERAIITAIRESGAKLVLAALGVPKQEKWLVSKLQDLDGVVGMGVGGSFDVLAGQVKRAPLWMQKNRLEWLYRLMNQPQRILRMLALPKFMWAVKFGKKA